MFSHGTPSKSPLDNISTVSSTILSDTWLVKSLAPLCTHSYLITLEGAKKLLAASLPIVVPVDVLMTITSRIGELRMFSASPRLFDQASSLAPTSLSRT